MVHKFVEFIPDILEDNTVYISIEYKTAAHLCACGCQREVITPISPTDWKLSFNGESISLSPSIGNWDFPCQSHYFIKNNHIDWAGSFSKEKIEAVKAHDRELKDHYYNQVEEKDAHEKDKKPKGFFKSIYSFLFD